MPIQTRLELLRLIAEDLSDAMTAEEKQLYPVLDHLTDLIEDLELED